MESTATTPSPPPVQNSSLPTLGGVFLLIAGILGILTWIIVASVGSLMGFSLIPVGASWIAGIVIICGVIGIIFSIIVLLGGIMAIQRKNWGFALVGSILGLFIVGPVFISSLLALIALIVIAVSRKEFK